MNHPGAYNYSKLKSPSNSNQSRRISGKPIRKPADLRSRQVNSNLRKSLSSRQNGGNSSSPSQNSTSTTSATSSTPQNYKLNLIPVSRTSKGVRQPSHGEITSLKTKRVCYYAHQGPRAYMEDTLQIMHFTLGGKKGTFYGVFDGHGGSDVSFELVHARNGIFPYLIERLKRDLPKRQSIETIIKNGFLDYDRKLYQSKNFNAGSTAIVALYFNNKIYMVNLGDSRGMIFTQNGTLAVSDDHKPNKPKERRRIYRAGHFVAPFSIYTDPKDKLNYNIGDILHSHGKSYIYIDSQWNPLSYDDYTQIKSLNKEADTFRVSGSLALSRSFGDFYLKEDINKQYMGVDAAVSPLPDIQVIDLTNYKGQMVHIFLASDGFWDVNKNTEYFRKNLIGQKEPQEWCQKLVSQSISKGTQDNTTVMYDRIIP